MHVLEWLYDRAGNHVKGAVWGAVVNHEPHALDVLRWLEQNVDPQALAAEVAEQTEVTIDVAAEHGLLEVVQWLRQRNAPWSEGACAKAAGGGYLACLQWMRENAGAHGMRRHASLQQRTAGWRS